MEEKLHYRPSRVTSNFPFWMPFVQSNMPAVFDAHNLALAKIPCILVEILQFAAVAYNWPPSRSGRIALKFYTAYRASFAHHLAKMSPLAGCIGSISEQLWPG